MPMLMEMVEEIMVVPTKDLWVKYAASSFIGKALTWWNTQVQARGQDAANAMAWNDFKALLTMEFCPSNEIEKLEAAILIVGILTDEAVRSGTLAKAGEKRKERDEASKSESVGKDEKKAKGGQVFVAAVPPRRENGNFPKPGHMARDCRAPVRHAEPTQEVRPRNGQRACYECGSLDHLRLNYPKWNRERNQSGNQLALEGNRNT
ncbi:putative reverse transcriptase domain-containing protein [Tanacetum coccineum]